MLRLRSVKLLWCHGFAGRRRLLLSQDVNVLALSFASYADSNGGWPNGRWVPCIFVFEDGGLGARDKLHSWFPV